MYAGRRAAVEFNAQIMPADSFEVDLSVENVPITTIQILRDANIDGLISAVKPNWAAHGVPVRRMTGGIREVTGKLHGFWKTNASIPTIGDTVAIVMLIDGAQFFVMSQCLVTKMTIKVETKGTVEWDMDFEAISDTDFTGRF